jgi:hypothetical protein
VPVGAAAAAAPLTGSAGGDPGRPGTAASAGGRRSSSLAVAAAVAAAAAAGFIDDDDVSGNEAPTRGRNASSSAIGHAGPSGAARRGRCVRNGLRPDAMQQQQRPI